MKGSENMIKAIHKNIADITVQHKNQHEGYEYYKRELVLLNAEQCQISLYEIPPKKAGYPYHYHMKNEETFYIIRGKGLLKTPSGNREVSAGDFLFFPANESGALKLTNTSETEMLVYLDFSTYNKIDVAIHPDSEKVVIWGEKINKVFKLKEKADYYDGE